MRRLSGLGVGVMLTGMVLAVGDLGLGRTGAQSPRLKGQPRPSGRPEAGGIGSRLERKGDEIMVCGQLYHTTAKVVLWTDPGGYDAYRVERRFAPIEQAAWGKGEAPNLKRPNRYGARRKGLSPTEIESTRGGGWDLPTLAKVVDQFVIHFDARGSARKCFEILHDVRGLSVHFMIDLDGTIYQTLDVKEAAWHATIANGRSIGVEIANIGAYPANAKNPFDDYYLKGSDGKIHLLDPDTGLPSSLRPAGGDLVSGDVQGQTLKQYDFTPEQYNALTRLAATLCTLFPKIHPDYPRDSSGKLIPHKLDSADYARFQGILGHYHVQINKVDPGPAFQWEQFIRTTRALMKR